LRLKELVPHHLALDGPELPKERNINIKESKPMVRKMDIARWSCC